MGLCGKCGICGMGGKRVILLGAMSLVSIPQRHEGIVALEEKRNDEDYISVYVQWNSLFILHI